MFEPYQSRSTSSPSEAYSRAVPPRGLPYDDNDRCRIDCAAIDASQPEVQPAVAGAALVRIETSRSCLSDASGLKPGLFYIFSAPIMGQMQINAKVANKKDIADYIAEISEELASMADNADEGALAHILRQAVEEAKLILEKAQPVPS